jgi:hypothetical protein
MTLGPLVATIAAGLIYTLSPTSSSGAWIGYQTLGGIGVGLCFQAPIMAGQALAKNDDISTTTALLMFFQTLGGALAVSAGQAAFSNELIKSLIKNVPDADPAMVLARGAIDIRKIFPESQVPGIIQAYMNGLKVSFILVIALLACSTLVGLATPWINIKTRAKPAVAK